MEISIDGIMLVIFTIVYVIVTVIQGHQIKGMEKNSDEIKKNADVMSKYMNIFSIDEIKKYSELRAESAKIEADNFIADNKKVVGLVMEVMEDKEKEFWEFYDNEKKEEYLELFNLAIQILSQNQKNDKNLRMILDILPRTKDKLLDILGKNVHQTEDNH
jgi:hypothetical protein